MDEAAYILSDLGVVLSTLDDLTVSFADPHSDVEIPSVWGADWINPNITDFRFARIPRGLLASESRTRIQRLLIEIPSVRDLCIIDDQTTQADLQLANWLLEIPGLNYLALDNLCDFKSVAQRANAFDTLAAMHLSRIIIKPDDLQEVATIYGLKALLLTKLDEFPFEALTVLRQLSAILFCNVDLPLSIVEVLLKLDKLQTIAIYDCNVADEVQQLICQRMPHLRVLS